MACVTPITQVERIGVLTFSNRIFERQFNKNRAVLNKYSQSPIETAFLNELLVELSVWDYCPPTALHPPTGDVAEYLDYLLEDDPGNRFSRSVVLIPQARFLRLPNYKPSIRVDLLVWCHVAGFRMVLEFDGYSTHYNKGSFIADRQRDRALSGYGFPVRRYAGTEIFNNPIHCARDFSCYALSRIESGMKEFGYVA